MLAHLGPRDSDAPGSYVKGHLSPYRQVAGCSLFCFLRMRERDYRLLKVQFWRSNPNVSVWSEKMRSKEVKWLAQDQRANSW